MNDGSYTLPATQDTMSLPQLHLYTIEAAPLSLDLHLR